MAGQSKGSADRRRTSLFTSLHFVVLSGSQIPAERGRDTISIYAVERGGYIQLLQNKSGSLSDAGVSKAM